MLLLYLCILISFQALTNEIGVQTMCPTLPPTSMPTTTIPSSSTVIPDAFSVYSESDGELKLKLMMYVCIL